jgi:tight adherence protein B
MTTLYYLFGTAVFVAIVLAIEGGYLWWRVNRGAEAQRMKQRLQGLTAGWYETSDGTSLFKQRVLSQSPAVHDLLTRVPNVGSLDRLLLQSGLPWTVAYLVGMTLVAGVLGILVLIFFHVGTLSALGGGVVAATLPLLHVLRAKKKRLSRIEQQLPDAVDLIARALRAGHAFPNAVKMVGDEMTQPIAGEFKVLFDEVNYGISMQEALLNLANRIPSTDLKYLVIAVLIQRETGGNLAELLNSIGGIIRARLKLFGTIRVLSAEGRLSAWILSLLPVGAALLINIVNPEFMSILWTDPAGHKMIMIMVAMMAFGIFWMRKIIRIRV